MVDSARWRCGNGVMLRLLPFVLLLSACVASGTPLRDAALSDQAVVLTVPVVMQGDRFDCGVAVLSMLLAYYGRPADPEKADELRLRSASSEGLIGAELQAYMQSEGFEAVLFRGVTGEGINGLQYHLDRGRPLVVAIRSGPDANHFVLVTGYDPVNDWVLLQDPLRGALVFDRTQFEHAWDDALRFTLLATPKE